MQMRHIKAITDCFDAYEADQFRTYTAAEAARELGFDIEADTCLGLITDRFVAVADGHEIEICVSEDTPIPSTYVIHIETGGVMPR